MNLDKIKIIIAEQLNVSEKDLTDETSFINDLSADSLDIFQLITALEEEFNFEMPNEDIEKIRTIGDISKYISNQYD